MALECKVSFDLRCKRWQEASEGVYQKDGGVGQTAASEARVGGSNFHGQASQSERPMNLSQNFVAQLQQMRG